MTTLTPLSRLLSPTLLLADWEHCSKLSTIYLPFYVKCRQTWAVSKVWDWLINPAMAQVLSFSLTSAVVTKLFCLSTFPGSFLKLIILAVRYRAARGRYLILRSISANVLTMRSKIWSVGSVSTLYTSLYYTKRSPLVYRSSFLRTHGEIGRGICYLTQPQLTQAHMFVEL